MAVDSEAVRLGVGSWGVAKAVSQSEDKKAKRERTRLHMSVRACVAACVTVVFAIASLHA